MIHFRSVADMDMLIRGNLTHIPDVDCVVGVPRSGMLPATLIALYLGKPLMSIDNIHKHTTVGYSERLPLLTYIKRVLVVDDSCDSGNAMRKVKKDLIISEVTNELEFIYCAVYATQRAIDDGEIDFYFERVDQPRVFEWNILDHNILQNSCVDMDGVLCADPMPYENDDGEMYRTFLEKAEPKFIPHYTIDSIVTCRLEKYRPQTEEWLRKHNVKYRNLFMMNYPNAVARQQQGRYTEFKAEIYHILSIFILGLTCDNRNPITLACKSVIDNICHLCPI